MHNVQEQRLSVFSLEQKENIRLLTGDVKGGLPSLSLASSSGYDIFIPPCQGAGDFRRGSVISTLKKITISLPAEMLTEIKEAVRAGEFTNTSEAIRDALRRWRRSRTVIALSDEELRRLVAEGRASGEPVDGETALKALRAKYAALGAGEGG